MVASPTRITLNSVAAAPNVPGLAKSPGASRPNVAAYRADHKYTGVS
jgi:hypothetical protein